MKAVVDLQLACEDYSTPDQEQCEQIVQGVLDSLGIQEPKECTIRVVDEAESAELNQQYRGKGGPTNVLSFPFETMVEMDIDLLGDLVICAPVVIRQAKEQNKSEAMHWAHLIVHGCLHLLGYDHIEAADASKMEALEIAIMDKLGYPDPYQVIDPV